MKSPRGSNLLLRTAVVIVMALSIGAPTPGRISGCNTGSGGGVDAATYCEGFELRVCARDLATGRIPDAGAHDACLAAIPGLCTGAAFPAGCAPSQATVEACYGALVDNARLDIVATFAMPNLPECTNLCGGSGGGIDPEGI